ncbi:nitroreductase/quinone reductase family protein [Amycolatopsis sp. PS_44_ISF1]|uniref:nitroreductase/quinone reductase family protein n=1 Tax=Amycolatopsis sp. PS_44_ISF1 TaxID=2974917 RepID=UPI0028DE7E5C|nr:nitroreductase/quinone reductase family protein [Amycolatopsis sp. PS_44_ISF1]MDT8915158.1 nitroreductase family deazaflavin-dependent oxidoreductase [Amycolatopsis sp. PS_44_ISF1]
MDVQGMNAEMVAKLLQAPAEPVAEGEYALRVVETRGRASRQARLVPLAVVRRGGRQFLVSPTRERDWVRNLLADPACAVLGRDSREDRLAVAVPDSPAAEVVSQYLASMSVPWAIRAFPVAPDAPREEIRAHLGEMAVFELVARP